MTKKKDDLVSRLRSLADCDARAGEPLGRCMREAADEIERLRDVEITYEQIKRIALSQAWDDEYNSLDDPSEFASDLWKVGVLDIIRPRLGKE